MGVVQLPDELQRVIDIQVAEGRAVSSSAFLEEAVRRLVEETRVEEDELHRAAETGLADIAAGRYTTVANHEDKQRVHDRMMARLQADHANGD